MRDTFIENWFSVPIMIHQVMGSALYKVQKEIDNAIPIVKQKDLSNPWGDGVKTDFKYELNACFLRDYECNTLVEIVDSLTQNFLTAHDVEQKYGKIGLLNSWINFSNRGDYQYDHNHETEMYSDVECYISGAYFYKTNGEDGDLSFKSPNVMHTTTLDIFTKHPRANFKPQVGKILLFPSWLEHRVNLNKTDSERISISFNMGMRKAYI